MSRRAVIVTGSDSGIGRAVAVALAEDGHDVGITWHTDRPGAERTAELVAAAGARAVVRQLDVTDRPDTTIDELAVELGSLWGLVGCAGANHRSALIDDEPTAWRRALEVNLTGPVLCARAAAKRLVEHGAGGRLVLVTSIHEHVPLRYASAYAAAKAGLGMAARVLALELAAERITVNAVAPGHIATPMTGRAGVDPHSVALGPVPLGRPGGPHEVAALIALLVSDAGAYATGSSFLIDGGLALTTADALQRLVEGGG
jgi:NAD(P)-dependent dehydrogenase (short-subunit alcohol dehydrogenase family)